MTSMLHTPHRRPDRSRVQFRTRRTVLLLATLALVAATSSCFLLAPDSQRSSRVRLAIEAEVPAPADKLGALSPSCQAAADYLTTPDQLTAVARVWQRQPGESTETLAHEGPLQVGAYDADTRKLELSGTLDLDVASAGVTYRLEVTLLAVGDRMSTVSNDGVFSGTLALSTGLAVHVDQLLLSASALPVSAASVTLSDPSVNDGTPATFTLQGLSTDPATGTLTAHYDDPNLEWDNGTTRHLVVTARLGLSPVGIYEGSIALPDLAAGVTQEVSLPMQPTGLVPGELGERLSGQIVMALVDGEPLQETGTLNLKRDRSLCAVP